MSLSNNNDIDYIDIPRWHYSRTHEEEPCYKYKLDSL